MLNSDDLYKLNYICPLTFVVMKLTNAVLILFLTVKSSREDPRFTGYYIRTYDDEIDDNMFAIEIRRFSIKKNEH